MGKPNNQLYRAYFSTENWKFPWRDMRDAQNPTNSLKINYLDLTWDFGDWFTKLIVTQNSLNRNFGGELS